jgi:hypothetical protein
MKLNRDQPFGVVGGDYHGAVTFQGGHYFDAQDNYVLSAPGVTPPPGVKPRAAPDAPEAVAETSAAPAEAPVVDGLTREQTLNQLSVTQLKTLMAAAGGEPVIGSGAKKKMIDWLLANTQ